LIRDGKVVKQEIFAANESLYFKHEIVLMLGKVGFCSFQVNGDWTDEEFSDGHEALILIASK
jgi:hypothetical protein